MGLVKENESLRNIMAMDMNHDVIYKGWGGKGNESLCNIKRVDKGKRHES